MPRGVRKMHEHNQFQKTPLSHPPLGRNALLSGLPTQNLHIPDGSQELDVGARFMAPKEPTSLPPGFPPTPHDGSAEKAGGGSQPGLRDALDISSSRSPFPFDTSNYQVGTRLIAPSQPRRKRITATLVGSILLVLVAISYVTWNLVQGAVPAVTLYQVGAQNASQDIGGGGIVYPRQQLDISYPVAERIVGVLVKPGDQISLNQPLIQLDPAQLNAQIRQAADDMAAAQAYLNSVSSSGNAVTIAQAQQAFVLAKNKYNALIAEASSPLLHNGNLISPLSGVVTTVNVNPGEVFAADTPLLTIMDESIVIVHVKVPLANLGQVHLNQTALVTPSALPNQQFHGTVTAVIPQADPQTDTFEVWIAVVNADMSLLPGMSAYVRIQSSLKAMAVPRLAILDSNGSSLAFVVRGTQAYARQVHIAGRSSDTILVDAGLSEGDRVVLVGLDQLRDGETVHVTSVERWKS